MNELIKLLEAGQEPTEEQWQTAKVPQDRRQQLKQQHWLKPSISSRQPSLSTPGIREQQTQPPEQPRQSLLQRIIQGAKDFDKRNVNKEQQQQAAQPSIKQPTIKYDEKNPVISLGQIDVAWTQYRQSFWNQTGKAPTEWQIKQFADNVFGDEDSAVKQTWLQNHKVFAEQVQQDLAEEGRQRFQDFRRGTSTATSLVPKETIEGSQQTYAAAQLQDTQQKENPEYWQMVALFKPAARVAIKVDNPPTEEQLSKFRPLMDAFNTFMDDLIQNKDTAMKVREFGRSDNARYEKDFFEGVE